MKLDVPIEGIGSAINEHYTVKGDLNIESEPTFQYCHKMGTRTTSNCSLHRSPIPGRMKEYQGEAIA